MDSSKISQEKKVLSQMSLISLEFLNKNLEKEYSEIERRNITQHNKSVSILSIALSVMTLTYVISVDILETKVIDNKNLRLETLTNKTYISEINSNKSSISPEYLFYNKFLLINDTKFQSGNFTKEECLLSTTDQELYFLVGSLWFIPVAIIQTSTILILFLIFLSFNVLSKNMICQKILCCLVNSFFTQSFHMNSGMLIVHFRVPTESVFFILSFNLMIKTFLTYKYKTRWSVFALGTILGNIFEWAVYLSIISLNHVLLFYLIVNCVVHCVIIVISYLNELNYRNEFLLKRNLNKEIKYANDILYNMSQGFITYNNQLLFINRSMKRILNYFNRHLNQKTDRCLVQPDKFLITSKENLFLNKNDIQVKFTESSEELNKNNHPQFEGKILETNVSPNTKFLIELLFSKISEFSSELHHEIFEKFPSTFSGNKKMFNLDKFYTIVKEKEIIFSSFTYLGIINLICPEDIYPNKKFQVMFRVIQNDNQENYLEFMLNDASELVQNEREEAVVNSRTVYLSKIAHEFKNPISSIMELSTKISEESEENNLNIQRQNRIISNASYINILCKVMIQFLKDYTLFSGLKFKCDCCNENKLSNCKFCLLKKFCEKCELCKICEDKKESIFDSIEVMKGIVKTFKSLGEHEKQADSPVFQEFYKSKKIKKTDINISNRSIIPYNISENFIKTNKEILFSALYNIVFYTYKSSLNKGIIKVKINKYFYQENPDMPVTQYEIISNSILIDSKFLNILYSNSDFKSDKINRRKNSFEFFDSHKDYSSDLFSKYFEIYIAFYMVKKLGSHLSIDSTRDETRFYFDINSQLEVFPQKNLVELMHSNNSPYISNTSIQISNLESLSNTIIYNDQMQINYNNLSSNFKCEILQNSHIINLNTQIKTEIVKEEILHQPENPKFISNGQNIDIKKIRVLIVDDETLIRNTLRRHFTKITKKNSKFLFEVTEAANCFQALQILYEKFNDNILFDFIVIDEYMPNMKGSTLIKLLKQISSENNFYKINIISHTAFDSNEKRQFILDSGADYILGKPVLFADLEDLVLKIIKS